MLDFLLQYWKLFVIIGLIVINIILSVIKKPKVINTIFETISSFVPSAINEAERAIGFGAGSKKLEYAVNYVLDYLCFRFDLSDKDANKYRKFIVTSIENCLSTPQKKKGD